MFGMSELHNISIDPQKLVQARGERSMAEVARATGLSRQQLWNYENALFKPSADTVARLCLYYQIPIEKLTNLQGKAKALKNLKRKKIAA